MPKYNQGKGRKYEKPYRSSSINYNRDKTEKQSYSLGNLGWQHDNFNQFDQARQFNRQKKEKNNHNQHYEYQQSRQKNHQKANKQFYIQPKWSIQDNLPMKILEQIQLLDYHQKQPQVLQSQFIDIIKLHITFDDIFPIGISQIGQNFIENGLFHYMWGIVLKRLNEKSRFNLYYQKYYQAIQFNHSNFESMFNSPSDSSEMITSKFNAFKLDLSQQQKPTQNMNEKAQNGKDQDYNTNYFSNQGRLRLIGHIQTNERRIRAEIICFFLGLKKSYRLQQIQISKVIEYYPTFDKQLILLEAHVPFFCSSVNKVVIDYRPKILIGMNGYVSLCQLLRIKKQYPQLEGYLLADQLLNIALWLKSGGYLEQ